MADFQVTLIGDPAEALRQARTRIAPRVLNGQVAAANTLMAASIAKVPVDTSALAKSAHVRVDSEYGVIAGYAREGEEGMFIAEEVRSTTKGGRPLNSMTLKQPWLYARKVHDTTRSGGFLSSKHSMVGGMGPLESHFEQMKQELLRAVKRTATQVVPLDAAYMMFARTRRPDRIKVITGSRITGETEFEHEGDIGSATRGRGRRVNRKPILED